LAAYGYALKKTGDEEKAVDFLKALFKNVPMLDTGARGSTTTFIQRGMGDVLLSWENEAFLALAEKGAGEFEIIYPSVSILAEPTVALVDKNAEKNGTSEVALAYLEYLYTPKAQELAAKHFFRPRNQEIMTKFSNKFPKIGAMMTINDFGGWHAAQMKHFADGGIFDKIYGP
jgi:sulfate transport system substrate-binding protein